MDKVFWASRYDKGTPDYLNCPLNKEEYEFFYKELLAGETVAAKPFEEARHFESCLPIEVLAARGEKSLAFGPMKPVGLINPHTGAIPYAVVQLRKENSAGTLFNMVGFQTKLTWPEQRRIFRLIPGSGKRRVRPLRQHSPQHLSSTPLPFYCLLCNLKTMKIFSLPVRLPELKDTLNQRRWGFWPD